MELDFHGFIPHIFLTTMVLFAVSFFLLVAGASGVAQLCPCAAASTWSVATLDVPSKVKPSTNTSQCLAITPSPPTWGPEGSGAVMVPCGGEPAVWEQWTVGSTTKEILWPKNSSLCLTVLPPKPAPKALVGLWFCGKQGFAASQAFVPILVNSSSSAAPLYQLQLENTGDDPALCVSLKGSC